MTFSDSPPPPVELSELLQFLGEFAPLDLAEAWDNVGLLLGDQHTSVRKVLTCLTLTPDVAAEAVAEQVELIVTHHPVLFRPVQQITATTTEGKLLLELLAQRIAVYSPHTAFDSATLGINQRLANGLGLTSVAPLRPAPVSATSAQSESAAGSGRWGKLHRTMPLGQLLERVKSLLNIPYLQYVGDPEQPVQTVAVACGSAAEFLSDAAHLGCDVFLTGEARFHACLEARQLGIPLILAGHYATERPAVEELAQVIQSKFPTLNVFASRVESDPLAWSLS